MKVYNGVDEFEHVKNAVVTTGTFDGVHLGHRTIIDRLIETAKLIDGETVLLTFFPHPRMVLYPEDNTLMILNTRAEKIELLDKAGIDHLIIHPFTKDFSRLSSIEFVRDILVNKMNTKKLVIGYDHHFGKNREGTFEHLLECGPLYGFEVEEIPAQDIEDVNVSSTKIRNAINEGKMDVANKYLGTPYSLDGLVIEGNKVGRTLDYPTANLFIDFLYKQIPANGVYAVIVTHNGEVYKGMANIGIRPTLKDANKKSIEVHLLDFDEDIYGQKIKVEFLHRIRAERKFENLEALKKQLDEDKVQTINLVK